MAWNVFLCAWLVLPIFQISAIADAGPPFRVGDPRLAAAQPPPMDASGFARGNHLVLEVQRDFARPQDRWVDVVLDLSGLPGKLDNYTLEASLSIATTSENLGSLKFTPEAKKILLQVDMRRTSAPEVWVLITASSGGKRIDGVQVRLRAEGPENPLEPGETIPVKIDFLEESAASGSAPVVIGVPFAPGQLWSGERLSLQTTDGVAVPFQREVTGTWIDGGSIQWVQFRTIVEPDAKLVVAVGAQDAQPSPSGSETPLVSKTSADQLSMKAGANRVLIGKGPSPILEVIGKERSIATSKGARGLYLVDSKGRLAQSAANADITIEANGPLYACVRIEADYVTDSEEAVARHITRIESWKDRDAVSITHTLVLTRDTNELWFQEAGWEFSIPGKNLEELRAVFAIDANDFQQVQEVPIDSSTKAAFIFQESYPSIGGGQAAFQIGKEKDSGGFEVGMKGSAMGDWGDTVPANRGCSGL